MTAPLACGIALCVLLAAAPAHAATWDSSRWDRDSWDRSPEAPANAEYVAPRYYEGRSRTGSAVVGAINGGSGAEKFESVGWSSAAGTRVTEATSSATYQLSNGLLEAKVKDVPPGGTVTLRLTFAQTFPAGTVYMKYGPRPGNPTSEWYVFPHAVIQGNTITLTLTDGGIGDSDLTANGFINDPGGPAIPVQNNGNGGGGGGGNGGGGTSDGWRLLPVPGQLPFKKEVPPTQVVQMDRMFLSVSPDTGEPLNYYTPGSEGFVMHGNRVKSFFDLNGSAVQTVTVADLPACSAIAFRQGQGNAQTNVPPRFMISSATPAVDIPVGWSLVTFLGVNIHPAIEAIISVGDGKEAKFWSRDGGSTLAPSALTNLPVFAYFSRSVKAWNCGQ